MIRSKWWSEASHGALQAIVRKPGISVQEVRSIIGPKYAVDFQREFARLERERIIWVDSTRVNEEEDEAWTGALDEHLKLHPSAELIDFVNASMIPDIWHEDRGEPTDGESLDVRNALAELRAELESMEPDAKPQPKTVLECRAARNKERWAKTYGGDQETK